MEVTLRTLAARSSIVLGLVTAVATILYLTPLPDQYPQSCSRACHELDWPMICRVKLTLERYQTVSSACGDCPKNSSDCYGPQCATADGRKRGILTANRQFPGPNLQVCQNDVIVVDIVNRVPGRSFGVHWRGQSQIESPHMDGVPMITQCPIPSYTVFQYKFRASQAGTHMWQVNTGEEMLETLFGAFVVKRPESQELYRNLYDFEEPEHVVAIHTLSAPQRILAPSDAKLLINGKVTENGFPGSVFRVSSGKSYRFRVVFGGDSNGCLVRLSVDDHDLLVLALDGNHVKPRKLASVLLAPGERVDFVLTADQAPKTYEMRVEAAEACTGLSPVTAELIYDDRSDETGNEESAGGDWKRSAMDELESVAPIPDVLKGRPDASFFLFYSLRSVSSQSVFNTSFVAVEDVAKVPQVNNLTMMFPSSPLLSQLEDVNAGDLCSEGGRPESCTGICECVHVIDVRLGDVVELVLVNQDDQNFGHVFHFHGHTFRVLATAVLPKSSATPEEIRELVNGEKILRRNLLSPVVKDTIAIPADGVAVVRFKADNPGYWLLDDEHSSHSSRGMGVVFRVGKPADVPPAPPKFPKCGNWIGPEFFLA